ncbi:MAG: GNAT family N-acetyltransferase [Candidatus Delongbacteria bacterium]|nr:GNAT family N-acetyltransferase [Candidatus Cloacimonadota bacterium]MCB9474889.1 GNAT family N-acetyltransferase [Candidatus Delongbacteria bacterium]
MNKLIVSPITDDLDTLASWLSRKRWPFHRRVALARDDVLAQAAAGHFHNEETRSFWLAEEDARPFGFLRLFDLADPTPLFDLRIRADARGRGLGSASLRWATQHVFDHWPTASRFGGYTRHDNTAMCRVFERCGFTLEARHREAWRTEQGELLDTLGWFVLRREWPTAAEFRPRESTV